MNMVEPSRTAENLRSETPKPSPSQRALADQNNFYASLDSAALKNSSSGGTSTEDGASHLAQSDASEAMPANDAHSAPDHGSRPGPSRRRSQPNTSSSRRPPNIQPVQSHGYSLPPSQNPPDASHSVPSPASYQRPQPHYSPSSVPYPQRSGYVGQYTLPMAPPPMSMGHSPQPFPYPHSYHPDASMVSPPIHANYQPMLPVYQYQRHSPESGSTSRAPYAAAPSPNQLYPHQVTPSPPLTSLTPQASVSSGSSHSSAYAGSHQFHSLQYSTPTPPYSYAPQSFTTTSPVYQSQYPPGPYPQRFPPSDQESQGTWWYVPSQTSPQYEGHPQYAPHYPVAYPVSHRDIEARFTPPVASPGPGTPGGLYQMSPQRIMGDLLSDTPPPPSSSSSFGPARASSAASPNPEASPFTGSVAPATAEKAVSRRSYHPNPPAHRSEWVMWAGNVPNDATHDEVWRFFTAPPQQVSADEDSVHNNGVMSIFLIARSCCCFVNFDTEPHLQSGIDRFNGLPLRPSDPRCPRLVCRVRRKDDDLKAGVGGQRGSGMHIKWIKDQKGKRPDTSRPSDSSDDPPTSPSSASDLYGRLSVSSDDEGRLPARGPKNRSSGSGSYASTNSSILTRHFPRRYFILKSLTQHDLDLSVERGIWATQKHNEGILDQAFRTSQDVFLIFGVNKSGEFYGYARMAGPVGSQSDQRAPWASRTDSSPSSKSSRSFTGRSSIQQETIDEEPSNSTRPTFFSPGEGRLVDESPADVSPDYPGPSRLSAPPELGPPHARFSASTPSTKYSLDQPPSRRLASTLASRKPSPPDDFELDESAPFRAMRHPSSTSPVVAEAAPHGTSERTLDVVEEEKPDVQGEGDLAARDEAWGEEFKVEWLCMKRLPFHRTRHLRNPWNHDREVKVSRDGTELEPTVGQQLLEEWDKLSEPQSTQAQPAAGTPKPAAGGSRPARPLGSSKTMPGSTAQLPAVVAREPKEPPKGGH